ncbi:MAG: DUF11 domain-containing protein [Candidatus Doudnabacteria bacterium]|nr:DUF11 domain-containing protein [Candidatus Doudnabacteria bacterium]
MQNDFKPQEVNQPEVRPDLPSANKSFYQANKFYIWAIVFGGLIIGVLAYFAFRLRPVMEVKEANVRMEILSPETLASGGEGVYRVVLRNNDTVRLTAMELELAYPDGIVYVESTPKASNILGNVFKVPDLLPGQNVAVIVKVKATGDINAQKTLLARLHYKYSNFNSSFVKEVSREIRLTASDVVLEMEGPKETSTAQVVIYSIRYKNNSKDTIKNVRIKLTYPSGFNYGSSEPSASLGGNVWNIGDLQNGGEGKISLQGTFSASNSGESKKLLAEFLTLGGGGEYFVQNTAEVVTDITTRPLLVFVENLDDRGSGVVNPGETINFAVRYQNNAQVAATAVNILVSLDSKALDLSSLQAQGGQVISNTITWNAAGVPNLESINPSEQGTLNFYVKLKNPATKDSTKNLTVKVSPKIKANEYSTFLPGDGIELKIASPAQVAAELSYLDGSLPPKVGTQTRYKATFRLVNSSNDFSSGELTCFLPTVAGSFNEASINPLEKNNTQFDSSTGKLAWRFGSLLAHTGKFSPAKILEFEVTLNPSPSDVGNSPVLLRNIKLFAKDNFTNRDVNLSTEDLTTASVLGQTGYYDGVVVP